ncbi:MAG: hypothetical protein M0Q26_10030 [Chitinophagaceae bacterium]|nr:hypothetical protein [Chitinophagaceae bacterium]
MKKAIVFLGIVFVQTNTIAQTNTFPSSGNAGIGTITPVDKFEVVGGIHTSGTAAATKASEAFFDYYSGGSRIGVLGPNTSTNGTFRVDTYRSNASNPLTSFYIDANGNVGMGTTSPGALLDVSKGATGLGGQIVIQNTTESSGNYSALSFNSAPDKGSYQKAGIFYVADGSGFGRGYLQIGLEGSASSTNVTPSNATGVMVIKSNGNVGIGTATPGRSLDVNGDASIGTNLIVGTSVYTNTYTAGSSSAVNFKNSGGTNIITYLTDGNVGIGTISPSEKLSVNGNIRTKKLIVTQTGWSDYVFGKNYKLRSLQNLEAFINQYKHLPEVPTAKEVETKGISVGDNQALLLKKIEELTLYVIDLKNENKKQQTQIDRLLKTFTK